MPDAKRVIAYQCTLCLGINEASRIDMHNGRCPACGNEMVIAEEDKRRDEEAGAEHFTV